MLASDICLNFHMISNDLLPKYALPTSPVQCGFKHQGLKPVLSSVPPLEMEFITFSYGSHL